MKQTVGPGPASQLPLAVHAKAPPHWQRALQLNWGPFSQVCVLIAGRPKRAPAIAPKTAGRHRLRHRRQLRVVVESGLRIRTAKSVAARTQLRSRECAGCHLSDPSFFAAPGLPPSAPTLGQQKLGG